MLPFKTDITNFYKFLDREKDSIILMPVDETNAEVAELADALRSGRSESTLMRVQIPPSAQRTCKRVLFLFNLHFEYFPF